MKINLLTMVALATSAAVSAAPIFSENFDSNKYVPGTLKGKTGIAIVSEPVLSAPHSLQVARLSAPEMSDLRFKSPIKQSCTISFHIFINEKSRSNINLVNARNKYPVSLNMRADQPAFIKGEKNSIICRDSGKLPANKWIKFELMFDFASNSCSVACTIDGKRVVDSQTIMLEADQSLIGLRFFNSPNGGKTFYDDISVTGYTPAAADTATAGTISAAAADKKRIMDHLSAPSPEYWKWVFYGDSITHCYNNSRGFRSFSELFNECLRYECGFPRRKDVVINSGLSGHNTVNLSHDSNFIPLVLAHKPQVVFLMIGANDIVLKEMTVEKFKSNLSSMVKRVRAAGAIPIVMTYNTMIKIANPEAQWQKDYLRRYNEFPAYNDAIRQVAADCDCLLIDHNKHWQANAADEATLKAWMDDELHPGAKGQFEMAKVILQFFNMGGAKSRVLKNEPPIK